MDWQTVFDLLGRLDMLDPMDPEMRPLEAAEMSALLAELRYERDRRLRTLYADVLRLVALDDRLSSVPPPSREVARPRAGGGIADQAGPGTEAQPARNSATQLPTRAPSPPPALTGHLPRKGGGALSERPPTGPGGPPKRAGPSTART